MKRYLMIVFLFIGGALAASGEESSGAKQTSSTNGVSNLETNAVLSSVTNAMPHMTSNELARLQKKLSGTVRLGTIQSDTVRDDKDKKIELFKFNTYQDKRDDVTLTVRVTIELTDKAGQTCFAQISRTQASPRETEYTGEDNWEFRIPHGKMERPKVTAYAVQYGILQDGVLTPVVEQLYKVKSVDEITSRVSCRNDAGQSFYYYWYVDDDGNTVSTTQN
ncbi:MAG: hypothetical protein HOO88_09915 [Kiritimatiellaceae bacterium]|nr:hypothetical protein [Kiritimatiellaceae bacterium]